MSLYLVQVKMGSRYLVLERYLINVLHSIFGFLPALGLLNISSVPLSKRNAFGCITLTYNLYLEHLVIILLVMLFSSFLDVFSSYIFQIWLCLWGWKKDVSLFSSQTGRWHSNVWTHPSILTEYTKGWD